MFVTNPSTIGVPHQSKCFGRPMDRLSEDLTKRTMQVASVIGRDFRVPAPEEHHGASEGNSGRISRTWLVWKSSMKRASIRNWNTFSNMRSPRRWPTRVS